MKMKWLGSLLVTFATLGLATSASAYSMLASDTLFNYDANGGYLGTGRLSTQSGADTLDAQIVTDFNILPLDSLMHVSMDLFIKKAVIPGTPMGTSFQSAQIGPGSYIPIYIYSAADPGTILLEMELIPQIGGSGSCSAAPFFPSDGCAKVAGGSNGSFSYVNVGSSAGTHLGRVQLVGGTKADNFGGVGAEGNIVIAIDHTSSSYSETMFDSDFTGNANIEIAFPNSQPPVPEPGTGLLVSLGLIVLVAKRRRTAA